MVQLKTSYDWILGILNTSLWITLQVQFLLAGLLTDLSVSALMTQRFLNAKKRDVLLPLEERERGPKRTRMTTAFSPWTSEHKGTKRSVSVTDTSPQARPNEHTP